MAVPAAPTIHQVRISHLAVRSSSFLFCLGLAAEHVVVDPVGLGQVWKVAIRFRRHLLLIHHCVGLRVVPVRCFLCGMGLSVTRDHGMALCHTDLCSDLLPNVLHLLGRDPLH